MSPLTILLAADPQASALFQAIGAALTEAQQLHVSANWPQLAAWLKTEEGRITAWHARMARRIGAGNLSEGVRLTIEDYVLRNPTS